MSHTEAIRDLLAVGLVKTLTNEDGHSHGELKHKAFVRR
jgi:hypothetical protein